jgi:hypothetical protein
MSRKLLLIFTASLLVSLAGFVIVQGDEDDTPIKFYTSHTAHERLGMIDLESGAGIDIGAYANADLEINRTGWLAGNGAIYENDFYIIVNKRLPEDAEPAEAGARLAKVNMDTGETELIGSIINLNVMALEISYCGDIFTSGFTLSNTLGELFGDTNLYHVDPHDASLTLIGDTGIERIMDLSFDPDGVLWATTGNVLYTLDQMSGLPTEVATITGVEEDNEIMGIGFTSEGELYGTSPWIDGLYNIDPMTGVATEVGRHGFAVVHGGDIPMIPKDTNCNDMGDHGDVKAKIESAMSAAPVAIAENATIIDADVDENGDWITLREGTNGWTCMPALPWTPGNDPACFDEMWMIWNDALIAGTEPDITKPGLSYMLQGGSDASNIDPFIMEPPEGEDWVFSGPHVMLLFPNPLDTTYFTTDHDSGGPYVMWAGTPFEHIMMPVALEEE